MIKPLNILDATVNCVDCQGYTHNVAEGNIIHKINALIKTVNEIKQYLDWDEISRKPSEEDLCNMVKDPKYWKEQDPETVSKVELAFQKKYGETTQNSTNNSEKLHLFQGNEHFADTSKKIKRAADSANKNLDNALTVAVDALSVIKKIANTNAVWDTANTALESISQILKITKGE